MNLLLTLFLLFYLPLSGTSALTLPSPQSTDSSGPPPQTYHSNRWCAWCYGFPDAPDSHHCNLIGQTPQNLSTATNGKTPYQLLLLNHDFSRLLWARTRLGGLGQGVNITIPGTKNFMARLEIVVKQDSKNLTGLPEIQIFANGTYRGKPDRMEWKLEWPQNDIMTWGTFFNCDPASHGI